MFAVHIVIWYYLVGFLANMITQNETAGRDIGKEENGSFLQVGNIV